ncbi:MAG: acyltransferase [Candidatus Pseudobacter hemicellulosilyticus]|uniref:Acyltransferase n=1 Tax=Candidatus Pseudobacter hemicellulosilyticus TaxID=3121375 RepID=A0AAJ5WXK6_9BACT|nr:MAG: acyltransferase [Pseudobacter sp.]
MSTVLNSKPHYPVLDGLRGVAAIVVVAFHILETFNTSRFDQIINHGYLAVDFFFLLSGFVIGYAYDDRWGKMTVKEFFKRRLIRLQPMVVMGMIVGALLFYTQAGEFWPTIAQTPVWKMLLVMLIGFTLIPVPISMDIRGWWEMHPLDGPAWSLFFEYIGNILYALFIRRFSKLLLGVFVALSAAFLVHLLFTNGNGDVIGGWALNGEQLHIGSARLLYPFFAGLLLSRVAKLTVVRNAFLWCSLLLVLILALPRIGGPDTVWMNGLYESFAIILVFPLIVWLGASDAAGQQPSKLCRFLGDISYPIYITHYPLIYTYTAWVKDNKVPLKDGWLWGVGVLVASILLAYACFKLYDVPVRKWLTRKFQAAKA